MILLALLLAAAPAARHPFTPDDLLALRTLSEPELSPDGQYVVYTVEHQDTERDEADSDLAMLPLAGGEPIRLTSGEKSESDPHFSPDGRYLAFLADRDEKKGQVFLLDRRGGEAQRLTELKGGVSELAFSPDGKRLAVVARDPDPDEESEKESAGCEKKEKKARPIVIRRRQFLRDGTGYLTERRSHLHVVELATRQAVQITSGPYDDHQPVWSPDGKSIAFVSNRTPDPDSNQNTDIFMVEARAGAEPRRLSSGPGADKDPAFSPDGSLLAFVEGCDPKDMWYGTTHVAVVPVAGGPVRALGAALDRNADAPRFTPDGQTVLFLLEDRGNQHLARVGVAGGDVERVVAGERVISAFDVAPTGQLVVLESVPERPAELSRVEGAQLVRISHENDKLLASVELAPVERQVAKSADGTEIDFFLFRPPGKGRQRTVLWLHGGPVMQYANEFDDRAQVLAGAGYAVVTANPRGSSGRGTAFSRAIWADWGNLDFQDVMAAVDRAVALGVADPDRLGVGGWSYGGILTNYVITSTGRFKAAVSGASEVNYTSNYGNDHYQYEWESELGLPWEKAQRWNELSPFYRLTKVTTPTLVMGGADDVNVPLLNSQQLYLALKRLGRETELVIYPGETHDITRPSFVKDSVTRWIAWYDRFLKR